jgi:hypothetical protein
MNDVFEVNPFLKFKTHDENACMADAANAYFQANLFANSKDFFVHQRQLVIKHKRVYAKRHATVLLSLVRHKTRLHKRVFDFISGSIVLGKWPLEAKSRTHLAILDYYSEEKCEMHVEPIGLERGRLTLLFKPGTQVLPFTIWSVEQYLEQVAAKRHKLQLNVFHYVIM